MAEGTELKGVANTAATAGFGLMLVATLLALASLFLPWWTSSSAGTIADQDTLTADISLWGFDLRVAVQVADASGGTTLQEQGRQMTWDSLCTILGDTAEGAPGECAKIRACRAFSIITPVFTLATGIVLWMSRTVSPLLLLLGAALGMFSGIFAIIGVMIGVMVSTSGLQGAGVVGLMASMIVSWIAVSITFYAAGIAMPVDVPKEKPRTTRHQREKAKREQEEQVARDLEENLEMHRKQKQASNILGPDGQPAAQKKAPVMLRKVIYWGDEGGKNGDPIPQKMLEAAFGEMDEDGSGSIDMDELLENLELCDLKVSQEASDAIMKDIDEDGNGEISIHEFVEFFRKVEDLASLEERGKQRAQFTTFLCNFCFIAHIVIVSVLLMNFIGMDAETNPDGVLIFKNMLIAFSFVLGVLLICVICLPAARLTVGSNVTAWQRAYDQELATRMANRKSSDEPAPTGPKKVAAWGEMNLEGLTDQTINAAQYGNSYRLKKQQAAYQQTILQEAVQDVDIRPSHMGNGGMSAMNSRHSTKTMGSQMPQSRRVSKMETTQSKATGGSAVVVANDGSMERYDPEAYRQAALQSMQGRVAASFSPMQVRDMSMPHQEVELPGAAMYALQDNNGPMDGMPSGTGYYHREL